MDLSVLWAIFGPVKDSEHPQFIRGLIDFVHNDIGQAWDYPLPSPLCPSAPSNTRQFC